MKDWIFGRTIVALAITLNVGIAVLLLWHWANS